MKVIRKDGRYVRIEGIRDGFIVDIKETTVRNATCLDDETARKVASFLDAMRNIAGNEGVGRTVDAPSCVTSVPEININDSFLPVFNIMELKDLKDLDEAETFCNSIRERIPTIIWALSERMERQEKVGCLECIDLILDTEEGRLDIAERLLKHIMSDESERLRYGIEVFHRGMEYLSNADMETIAIRCLILARHARVGNEEDFHQYFRGTARNGDVYHV